MHNPEVQIARSNGVDLPILKVYLAGRICGENIDKCLEWRNDIAKYYREYKGEGAYPIAFIDPLNSGEADSVDAKGLTSNIPPNLIYDKDILSVETCDVLVANMEDFFEEDILDILNMQMEELQNAERETLVSIILTLQRKIVNRRENIGTIMELAIALYLKKPTILIVPERRRELFEKHPFTRRASAIVTSVDELIKDKWLNLLYKSIAGSTG